MLMLMLMLLMMIIMIMVLMILMILMIVMIVMIVMMVMVMSLWVAIHIHISWHWVWKHWQRTAKRSAEAKDQAAYQNYAANSQNNGDFIARCAQGHSAIFFSASA